MRSFIPVTSCALRMGNEQFERWNYDIMISFNLLFRTLFWFFLNQDMVGNIDCLDCTAAMISLSLSYLKQIFWQFSNSFQMIWNISVLVSQKWQLPEPALCKERHALRRTNCYRGNWVLYVVLPLTSCDLYCWSQCLRTFIQGFPHLFWLFLLQNARKSAEMSKINVHFSSSLKRPDGNLMEKCCMKPSL